MNHGPLCCVGHMGYTGVYKEGVGGGIKYRREELGVLEEAKWIMKA